MEENVLQSIPIYISGQATQDQNYSDVEESDDEAGGAKKPKRNLTRLSANLRGLMGEANLRFARGEVELAKKMCFEVIRQSPNAYEPYLTLAQMHENVNLKKYKGFLMLACHLQPSNEDIWCRLADLELQENQISEALNCYSRAIRAQPLNVELHMKRLMLVQEKFPERGKAILNLKLHIAKVMSRTRHEQIIQICSEVAKEHFEAKNYVRAIEALRVSIRRIPNKISQDVLNMMLELLLLSERYSECLDIFTQFCGFTFDVTVGEDMNIIINSYTIPENFHVDLKTKFIVCLIRLQSYQLVENLIQEMLEKDDIETYGMLYFDIAEVLMASYYYKEALQLLIPLVKSKNFSLAAIWLKHAECLSQLEMYDQAIEAYFTVISMAPNHKDVLYPLAMLLLKQDKKQVALKVLSQDLSTGKLHVAVLIEQMKLLKQIGDLENYWKCCELLLSRHCVVFKSYEELRVVLLLKQTVKEKLSKIGRFRMVKGDEINLEFNLESIFEPSVEDEYKLYKEVLQFAFDKKEYRQFQKFAFMGLCSKRFLQFFAEIFLVACFACIFSKDYYHGYVIAKELLVHHPENNQAWNYYSLVIQKVEEVTKCYRFFEAATIKNKMPQSHTELVISNYFCGVAHYAECINYFLKEYRRSGNSYAAFMIAMCMLQQYCQRKISRHQKKSMIETVTYLFFNYAQIRSKHAKQEAYYNMGRMYQQIGVFYLAEHFYKKVLKVDNEYLIKYPVLDLKKEAAYNLHLIYKSSGNFEAARRILWEHIVI